MKCKATLGGLVFEISTKTWNIENQCSNEGGSIFGLPEINNFWAHAPVGAFLQDT
jgi:hypothetical protein